MQLPVALRYSEYLEVTPYLSGYTRLRLKQMFEIKAVLDTVAALLSQGHNGRHSELMQEL